MYTPITIYPTVVSKVSDTLTIRGNLYGKLYTREAYDVTKTSFTNIGTGVTTKGVEITAFLSWDADTIRLILDTDNGLVACYEKPFGEDWTEVSSPTGW